MYGCMYVQYNTTEDEEAQLVCWGKKAIGEMAPDRAIGLVVEENQSILYDDGFTGGSKDFSIENMAGRMMLVHVLYSIYLSQK